MSAASGPPRVVRIAAPAKVNAWLEVVGRRADGFHELDTWMLALELCDEVVVRRVEPRGVDEDVRSLRIEEGLAGAAAGCPADGRNLAWRAAAGVLALARARGARPAALELGLRKSVPSEAGLGGGSADAAAAALGAAHVLGLDPAEPAVTELLVTLGSDCAFFLAAAATGAARCRGRGEVVEPVPLPAGAPLVVLVTPAPRAATPAVYRALRPGAPVRATPTLEELLGGGVRPFCRLEEPALAVAPALGSWRALLDDARAEVVGAAPAGTAGWGDFTLSGSGSSFFAFAPNRARARALLEAVCVRAKARDHGLRLARVVPLRARGVAPI